jgi:hypothetical protein
MFLVQAVRRLPPPNGNRNKIHAVGMMLIYSFEKHLNEKFRILRSIDIATRQFEATSKQRYCNFHFTSAYNPPIAIMTILNHNA